MPIFESKYSKNLTFPAKCDSGWQYYDETNYCYYFEAASSGQTVGQAQNFCVDRGANLVSIHSYLENNYIRSEFFSKSVYKMCIKSRRSPFLETRTCGLESIELAPRRTLLILTALRLVLGRNRMQNTYYRWIIRIGRVEIRGVTVNTTLLRLVTAFFSPEQGPEWGFGYFFNCSCFCW